MWCQRHQQVRGNRLGTGGVDQVSERPGWPVQARHDQGVAWPHVVRAGRQLRTADPGVADTYAPRSVPQLCRPVVAGGGDQLPVRAERPRLRSDPDDGHGRHRLGSFLAVGATRGEEGSLTFKGDTAILACPSRPGGTSSDNTAGRSDSQVINAPECSALLQGVLPNRVLERLQLPFCHVRALSVDTSENGRYFSPVDRS